MLESNGIHALSMNFFYFVIIRSGDFSYLWLHARTSNKIGFDET